MSYREDLTDEANQRMTDPEWAVTAAGYLKKMQDEKFGEMGRVLFQCDRRFGATISDAYWFMQAYTWTVGTGQIAIAHIRIGEGPGPDREMSDNQTWLQRTLAGVNALHRGEGASEPWTCAFTVQLAGGPGDDDGFIEWAGTLPFQVWKDGEFSRYHNVEDGRIPVEVGTTHIATTVQHFTLDRGVARWPYDSPWLTLLKVVDGDLLTPQFHVSIPPDSPSRIHNGR